MSGILRRLFLLMFSAVVLAACSSGVPLDETPQAGGAAIESGAPDGTAHSDVPGVDLNPSQDPSAGPPGVGHVVYFDYDSYVIRPDAQGQIEAHARFLRAAPNRHLQIDGHTDERGGREYNLALGQRRAEAVRRALALLGVNDQQMEAVSYGKEQPAAEGHDETAWAQNRRAELHYRQR